MKLYRVKNKKGFTLIEVLIVVIALAVLAGIAIPIYTSNVKKAQKAEVNMMLSSLRSSQARYRSDNGTYASSISVLDFDPATDVAPGSKVHFTYKVIGTPDASAFAIEAKGDPSEATSKYSDTECFVIDQTGAITEPDCT